MNRLKVITAPPSLYMGCSASSSGVSPGMS